MLIQALCEYYDVLERNGKTLPDGYSKTKISYLVELNLDGTINAITDCRVSDPNIAKGKPFPKEMILPERTQKTAVDSNIPEHRGNYIFGLSYNAKRKELEFSEKAKKKFEAFKEKNIIFFEEIDAPIAKAFYLFISKWNPEKELCNAALLAIGKEIDTAGFGFCLAGRPDILLHEDPDLKTKWDKYFAEPEKANDAVTAQCAIYGTEESIARIHGKLSGFGNSMGVGIVNSNESAFDSYGMSQSYNSNVSERAMKKYTKAMNYLSESKLHKTVLDDMYILHWAADDNEQCDDIFNMLVQDDVADREKTDILLESVMRHMGDGTIAINEQKLNSLIDPNVTYYVVGMKPNSSRLAIKFIYKNTFGVIIKNLLQHTEDMKVNSDMKQIPVWMIKRELISPKSSNETANPSTIAGLMEAIIMGTPYPTSLLETVIRRVKTDSDPTSATGTVANHYVKMNDRRIGLIKACINRNNRFNNQKEEIKMALDLENKNPAYICGRLFAVLENIQIRSAGYSLNRTIRDAYYGAAATQPSVTFPKLLSLSRHHLAKLKDKNARDVDVQTLVDMLEGSFPQGLSLKDQGVFTIGYYQQKAEIDRKIKEAKEKKENAEREEK